jgi:hypothetical protein
MHEAICIETWQDPLPLDQFLTYRLARVQARLNVHAAVLLKRHAGLTLSQWRIIALIGSGGHTKVSDFTRSMGLDKGLVSRNVRLLVEKRSCCLRPGHGGLACSTASSHALGAGAFRANLAKDARAPAILARRFGPQ